MDYEDLYLERLDILIDQLDYNNKLLEALLLWVTDEDDDNGNHNQDHDTANSLNGVTPIGHLDND